MLLDVLSLNRAFVSHGGIGMLGGSLGGSVLGGMLFWFRGCGRCRVERGVCIVPCRINNEVEVITRMSGCSRILKCYGVQYILFGPVV